MHIVKCHRIRCIPLPLLVARQRLYRGSFISVCSPILTSFFSCTTFRKELSDYVTTKRNQNFRTAVLPYLQQLSPFMVRRRCCNILRHGFMICVVSGRCRKQLEAARFCTEFSLRWDSPEFVFFFWKFHLFWTEVSLEVLQTISFLEGVMEPRKEPPFHSVSVFIIVVPLSHRELYSPMD